MIKKFFLLLFVSYSLFAAETFHITWTVERTNNIEGFFVRYYSPDSGVGVMEDVGYRTNYFLNPIGNNKYTFIVTPYDKNRDEGISSQPLIIKGSARPKNESLSQPKAKIEHDDKTNRRHSKN